MKLFDRFRKFIAFTILACFIPSQVWAQGITIPAGSTLNINTGQLTVPENITNAGTLSVTTGAINIAGNWTNSGVFSAGTSTVSFNAASGTQVVNSGGVSVTNDAFYNLTHSAAGTVQLITNPVVINDNFTNIAGGVFNANSLNMTVDGNWDNTSAATFTPGTNTVTLGGANGINQEVLGSTAFYDFSKINTGAATLTFDSSGTQTFSNGLTMQGSSGNLLSLRSTNSGTQAKIYLSLSGSQAIDNVNVKDSNAGTAGTQQTLVGRSSTDSGNNTNWDFNNATITWVGGASGDVTDWNNVANWNPMVVPAAGDSVIIPGTGTAPNQPNLCPSTHGSNPCPSLPPAYGVNLGNLTLSSTSSLTLNGIGLKVTGTFTNSGTVILLGDEPVSLTQDTNPADAGTFEYVGTGIGASDTLLSSYYNLIIDDTNATKDTFTAASENLAIAGNLTITSGILTAPGSSNTFTVAGNWTDHGTFNSSSGTVTLNGTNQSVLGTTTFYNFIKNVSSGGPYTLTFDSTSGAIQEFTNSLTLEGNITNKLLIRSTTSSQADIALSTSGAQTINYVNVLDSNAAGIAGFTGQTLTAHNSVDASPSGPTTNTNWVFENLSISAPALGTTVGQTPTIIGIAPAGSTVYIRDISGDLVATTKADANGNFRVAVGQDAASTGLPITAQLATGSNSLTPYLTAGLTNPGPDNTLTVSATPTTSQVPVITTINGVTVTNTTQFISGSTPTIAGQGAANQTVTVQALDANGNLLLTAGTGTVNSSGNYSVTLTTALPSATNFLSVTVGAITTETASAIIQVSLTDPFGVVYNTTTNQPIEGATVTLENSSKQVATGVQSCNLAGVCTTANPFTTLSDGFYSFLAPPGQYYLSVSAAGYTYPSVQTTVPSGRSVGTGSKGEEFTVGSTVVELDQPLDANSTLLRITKTANKTDASVGDIVMYTVNIQNLSATDPVANVYLNDEIPPGFKYIKDRVLLGGSPISEPSGQRPLIFNIGTVPAATTLILQYQLVIGSGVTMGNYRNTATAQFSNGLVISNPAQASVKIIPDPVFDLGDVIGKVFFDWNENGIQDPPYYDPISHETIVEKPVPNVQIVMEDGTVITTDRNGQYNIPGLLPGRHLFRLDERTLPPGAYLTTDKAVIVDITAGSITKVNFGVNIDESQTKGRDAVFFNEKIRLTQDPNRPVPRLNAALFNASANAKPSTEEAVLYEGSLVRQAEFRIFTNYSPFISRWRLDIMDADTRKIVRSFEGTPLNINDPIYWNGRDDQDIIINPDHKYSYVVSVADNKNNRDDTKEKPITVREIKDEDTLKKEREETKDVLKDRADRYRKWLDAQELVNNLDHQLIQVQGETIHLDRQGTDVKSIQVMKGNHLFTDIPLVEQYGLTPDELMAGGFSTTDEKDNLEIILPNGDYTLDVVSVKAPDDSSSENPPVAVPQSVPASGMPSRALNASLSPATLEHYSRPLKIGDDYMMFVALGDAQVGYNIDRGNIEPIQDSTEDPGFYKEGKGAYYLKGQILGKYLITSSFDSDRQTKALFRQLDPNTYYPVYGDGSSINYDAADTQGPLYLKVEWDKSSAILGNYVVDFNDTDFAAFSQKYYGGMIDYQSVSSNPYGDARTKLVIFHAQIQQLPSHNEFLATGGSLYFLKYKNVVQGSDTVTIQVRDETTGLVVASQTMTNGADYELDNSNGSILFWQPVAMIAQSESIISNNLINGDPIYVVVDYQYSVANMQTQGSQGARVAQSIGDNVVLGGTYVQDNSNGQNYTLEGTDATLHVNKDSTVKAEYAQTTSQETGSYVSTDGGITFTTLMLDSSVSGQAYGIKGDTRLFDNIGLKTYYKWVGNNFGATDTTSQQGSEKMGMSMTFDMTPVTRLTASEDIQRLLAQNNIQTSTQIGASETDTTMVQIVHTAERLKLTGQFQLIEDKSVINGVESTTNQRGATIGGQAQYDVTDRLKLTLGQQVDMENKDNTATTVGASDRVSDHTTLNAQDVFSSQGSAITAGVTNRITPKIALTNAYTLTSLNTGEVDKTVSVGVADQMTKNITTTGTVAETASSIGTTTTTASVGTIAKLSDNATLNMSVGQSQNGLGGTQSATNVSLNGTTQIGNTSVTGIASGGLGSSNALSIGTTGVMPGSNPLGIGTTGVTTTSSVGVQATTKVDNNTSTNGSVNIANDSIGGKTTTFGFGDNSKIDQELQAVTNNSFSFSPGSVTSNNTQYGLVNTNPNGQKTEADFTQQSAYQPGTISDSNIYGLSGDVNDKLAVNSSIQRGKVQNLGTSQSTITDFSLGSGYVLKDTESAEAKIKNSIKLELRLDKGIGTDSLRQYVFYDALEGKINDNTTANIKVDYSKTLDTTTGAVAERHQEIILGMAYRPVNFDNLNFITEYSYQDGYGGGLQQADALNTDVDSTITQVYSAEGVYDINEKWQAAEKIAYRLEEEQDTGFAFTQTHTWLVIHRLNYKIDRNWTISGEYRDLVQVEAKDNKQGLLLEATRDINANTQLAIGWNFTDYSDDLTDLSYTSQGPFVRMTGKFYDETPEERARARAKWLDARINEWAWIMIRKELAKKDSKIVLELNRMFALAKSAQKAGRLEESRQIYKDIIAAGQMMYEEASEHIRSRIAFEEQLQKLDKAAQDYFKGGEYVKARKIWEKVVEDASKGVVK